MSGHTNPEKDFWKKISYGATTAVAVGAGLYAVASTLKQRGFVSDFVDGFQTAVHTAARPPSNVQTSHDESEEALAVLNMQLDFTMKRGDSYRVQEIFRQIDELSCTKDSANLQTPASMFEQRDAQSQVSLRTDLQTPVEKQVMRPAGVRTPTPPTITGVSDAPLSIGMQVPEAQMVSGVQIPVPDTQVPEGSACSLGTPASHKQMRPQTALKRDDVCARPRKITKTIEPTRSAAMRQLQGGDIVEALDPYTCAWSPAVVHAISKTGLVEVRWDDPGAHANGQPFHPIGEVWAEQIRLKRRPQAEMSIAPISQETEEEPSELIDMPDGLQVGDTCYAIGQLVDKKWFRAKLIGIRSRSPPLRIEYMSTLDGQVHELLLPSPRKDYVNIEQVRRDKPEQPTDLSPLRRPTAKDIAQDVHQKTCDTTPAADTKAADDHDPAEPADGATSDNSK